MSEEHDLETTEETSAPAEMLDTDDQAYDLLFNQESKTEDAGSAENDVTEEEDSSAESVEATEEEETPQDAEETESTEEESAESEEDPEGISIPDSFRDITRDSLQTDEGRAVYDALSQAYKAMEADYTRKSQAVSGAENVLLEKEDAMREIFREGNVANPSHEQMLDTAVSEFIALRTDADYAQTLYKQLGNVLGVEPGEIDESEKLSDDDPRKELEQFKNEVRSELQAREEQEEVEKITQQLHAEWEDTVSNEEFKDFSEDDWKFVLSAWSAADEDSSAYAHAKALKSRYDAIAETKAKEAEEKQREYLKKKAQQPKVGAGSQGQNVQPTSPKPKNWDEADDLASKMLGL